MLKFFHDLSRSLLNTSKTYQDLQDRLTQEDADLETTSKLADRLSHTTPEDEVEVDE